MTTLNLRIVPPVTYTDAKLVSHSVPETDQPAWAAGTAYTVGQRVIRTTTHAIYERLVAGTTATPPENDPINWVYVSPTNRWKMFDTSGTSVTTSASTISVVIRPGEIVNSVALFGVYASSVRIRMVDPLAGTVYDRTTSMTGTIGAADWYTYFFDLVTPRAQVVALDLPAFGSADILIDIEPLAGTASVATLLIGRQRSYGSYITTGAKVSILDFSRKEATQFGDTVLVKRAFARRADFDLYLTRQETDSFVSLLATLRATPTLWVATGAYEALSVFGIYRDFGVSLSYPDINVCNLQIEGLT